MASIAAGVLAEHYGWGSAFYLAAGLYFLGFAVSVLMPGRRVRVEGG
jgi:dipeptide/tripeptide permease